MAFSWELARFLLAALVPRPRKALRPRLLPTPPHQGLLRRTQRRRQPYLRTRPHQSPHLLPTQPHVLVCDCRYLTNVQSQEFRAVRGPLLRIFRPPSRLRAPAARAQARLRLAWSHVPRPRRLRSLPSRRQWRNLRCQRVARLARRSSPNSPVNNTRFLMHLLRTNPIQSRQRLPMRH
jgi:hypothetical protein